MPIFAIQKKTNKVKVMEEIKKNYRITIIFKDAITIERYETDFVAMETIKNMKRLFPNIFIGGALEKKCKGWRVIWTLGNK